MTLPGFHPLDVSTPEGRAAAAAAGQNKAVAGLARNLPPRLYTAANVTSFDIGVDSDVDRLWVLEFNLQVVYNGTVFIRPNGSTLNCAEIRLEPEVLTGPTTSGGSPAGSVTAQGLRILNNPGGAAGGMTYATGRVQIPGVGRGNGERPAMVDTAWEQSIGSGNNLAGRSVASYRMGQYNTQITFLRVICDVTSGIQNAEFWLDRR